MELSPKQVQIDIEDDERRMISSMDDEGIKQAIAAVEGMFKQITQVKPASKAAASAPFALL